MTQSTYETITLSAPDISCGHCVNSIQSRLGELDGIGSVVASAETQKIDLSFDPAKITLDTIKAELEDEGYPVAE